MITTDKDFLNLPTKDHPRTYYIKKGETKQMCVPLDDYITIEAEEGYLIDQFYINYIEYEDGRIWKDEFGLYAAGGK